MVFSSIVFIFYFLPVFFLVYYLAYKKFKNAIILLGSVFFYAWGAPKFIFVLLGVTVIDFYVVRLMDNQKEKARRIMLLSLSLSINLGLLAYFKYSNFFVENVNVLLSQLGMKQAPWAKLVLPIGISFYTFETITYVVDVYRGVHKPLRNFWDYQMYIILFPKLIAGPIIRFHDFADQIYDHTQHETTDNKLRGLYRFFFGLGKKVLIANVMGANADAIFNTVFSDLGTGQLWLGILSYTFQIYFDFSGYSDMAIGLGLMMGFRFPENFNNPYIATSVTDFWRRWHITLGSWMRNYLYIPLGGNKVNTKLRLYFNLWLVFLASGLWHGATWGFIFWGAYHGFFLVIERILVGKWLAKMGRFAFLYTFPVVLVGWLFFKLESLGTSLHYLQRMFVWHAGIGRHWIADKEYIFYLFLAALFSFFAINNRARRLQEKLLSPDYTLTMHCTMMFLGIVVFILSAGKITGSDFNPFIYFRF
jgi:alginate O-acetyltransferase complex protein AlgI